MENIMLKVKGDLNSVTIIDFGLTKTIAPGEKLAETMGTLAFIAPEVISRNPYDKAVDVWSIGVVFYYLLSGKLPFYAETEENVTKKIKYSNPDYNEKVIGKRSEACIEMVKKCLEKKPEKRISIRNLLQSDWIKKQSKV
jgi:calcium-dependent protein kinase